MTLLYPHYGKTRWKRVETQWIPSLRPRNCSTLQPAKRASSRSSRAGTGWRSPRWSSQDWKVGIYDLSHETWWKMWIWHKLTLKNGWKWESHWFSLRNSSNIWDFNLSILFQSIKLRVVLWEWFACPRFVSIARKWCQNVGICCAQRSMSFGQTQIHPNHHGNLLVSWGVNMLYGNGTQTSLRLFNHHIGWPEGIIRVG